MIREIFTQKPWEYRKKSSERSTAWDTIAHVLNLLDGFNLSQRSIRNRYKTRVKKYKHKKSAEERASGIATKILNKDFVNTLRCSDFIFVNK